MSSNGKYALEIHDLHCYYGDFRAIKNSSLNIERYKITAFIGPSGCGKSTMLKHMIGLYRPAGGRIVIDGQDVHAATGRELARIRREFGVAFQGGALFGSLTVLENVRMPLEEFTDLAPDMMDMIALAKLRLVDLEGAAQKLPSEISGGMKKRVGLARALALEPEVLLYDEPTAGLDPVMSQNIDDLIVDMKKRLNMTSVVVTHDMISTLTIADRVAMLHEGKIVAVGTPREIENSSEPVVQEFIERDANWRRKS